MIRLAVVLIVLLAGCNPVARISANATAIRNEAGALIDHGNATGDQVVVHGATRIDAAAAAIHGDIPSVQAVTPAWLSTLQWWGIAVAVAGIAFLAWNSGIGTFVRIAIGWLPRRKVAIADLAASTLDESRPEGDRELIAAMRAQDSEFDAAFRNAAKRRKQKGTA
jgi:hypothetical protein